MSALFEVIGYVGTFLSLWAYIPQVKHLLQEHCSAGISISSYLIWLAASACILAYGVSIMATVIIVMQVANLLALSTILFFVKRYQGGYCPSHLPGDQKHTEE